MPSAFCNANTMRNAVVTNLFKPKITNLGLGERRDLPIAELSKKTAQTVLPIWGLLYRLHLNYCYNEGSITSSRHIGRGKVLFFMSGGRTSPPGGSGGMLPREYIFFNIEVKSINLVHFESNMKRSMDTSLNTHMKQNCKQILFFFMDILQITPLLNCIFVY